MRQFAAAEFAAAAVWGHGPTLRALVAPVREALTGERASTWDGDTLPATREAIRHLPGLTPEARAEALARLDAIARERLTEPVE